LSGRRRFGGEWQTRRLGNHLRFLRHGSFPRSYLVPNGEVGGGVKYLHYGDIHTSDRVHLDPTATALPTLAKDHARRLDRLSDGDLVFVDASEDIGGVGKSIEIIGSEGHQLVSGLHTIAVRFNKAVLADGFKAYLQFCPRFRDHLRRLAAGTKVYATNRVHIATAELRVPSLPEQRAIAAVLMDVDVLIGSLEALIAKKRAIKRAAMQQLLTGRTRLPGFDGEWGTMRLGECVQIRGDRVSSSKASGDTLCVELEDIEQATGRLIRRGLASSVSAKYSFETGDVLFGRLRPYLRKWWHADRPGVCSTEIWPLTSDPLKADSRFIYWLIRADTLYEAAQVSYGTHMPRADWKVVSEVPVPRPPIPEQRAIAAVLTDMDAEVEKLERRLAKTQAVKQGMMQQLLTGSIRLPIPDAIAESGPVQ